MDYLRARFNWTELKAMVRVFVWSILVKRLLFICLPLEWLVHLLGQSGPLGPYFEAYAPRQIFKDVYLLKNLGSPLALMAAVQWLIYVIFMFCLVRQLINIYLADIILRSCMQKRVVNETRCSGVGEPHSHSLYTHSCLTCYPRKIIWRLQDQGALIIHMVLGSIIFQTLPYYCNVCPVEMRWFLQAYWRGYLYYQYVFTRDGCCPEGMVYAYRYVPIWWGALQVGAFDTTVDLLCDLFVPSKTLYWFVVICLDFVIVLGVQVARVRYPEGVETQEVFSLNPVWMVWRMAQAMVVGGMGIAKRNPKAKSPIHAIRSVYDKAKRAWNGWGLRLLRRLVLWPEYRSYSAMVTKGPTAPYLRSQVMVLFEITSTVRDFMKDYDKRLVLLTGITSTPIVGSWVRMVLDPRIKNVATLLKKIGPKEVVQATLDGVLRDVQGPLAATGAALDPGKGVEQETVLYEKIEMVGGYFQDDVYRLVEEPGDLPTKRSLGCQTSDHHVDQDSKHTTDEPKGASEPNLLVSGDPLVPCSQSTGLAEKCAPGSIDPKGPVLTSHHDERKDLQAALFNAIHTPL